MSSQSADFALIILIAECLLYCTLASRKLFWDTSLTQKFIILDYYHGGIIEVGVFAAEDVAERIADEMGVTNHQVGTVM